MDRSSGPIPIIALIFGLVAGGLVTIFIAVLGVVPNVHYLPPCRTEDSDNCIWSGTVNGNHIGRSFVVIDGTVYYKGE
jgi:hypothetical protein